MLELAKLDLTFVDYDTGEVIRKYKFEQANEDGNLVDVQKLVTPKLLSNYVGSFIRGCHKRRNISLEINFNIETVF